MKPQFSTSAAGRAAEKAACGFLESRGLQLLQRNYRTRTGEIDLVMRDGDIIVFVEVRSRVDAAFMHPEESIDTRKRLRLSATGARYLQHHGMLNTCRCRFDVVVVLGKTGNPEFRWIENAFEA